MRTGSKADNLAAKVANRLAARESEHTGLLFTAKLEFGTMSE
jgi:hypothetical protein